MTYDGQPHTAEGTCTGVMGEPLNGLDLSGTVHTDTGTSIDPWSFVEENGNYNDQNGTVEDNISKAEAVCEITPYIEEYDREEHLATGACLGVDGNPLDGLDLTGTSHTEIGIYAGDPWVFSDVTGNYNDTHGSVDDEITLRYVTVVADNKTKVFGQPDPELTYQVTIGSLLTGDVFSGELSREPGEALGTYAILQGLLTLPDYYEITFVGANFTITNGWIFMPLALRTP